MRNRNWVASPIFWSTVAVVVDVGLARLGYGLVLPEIRMDLGGSYALYGFIGTAHFIGYLMGTIVGPSLLQRDPSARATATWSHVAVGALLVVSAIVPTAPALAVARALLGIACGVGIVAVVTGALERVPAQGRFRASVLIWSGIAFGIILSAAGTHWILEAPQRWRPATLLCAAFAFIAALGLWFALRAPVSSVAPGRDGRRTEVPFRLADLVVRDRYLLLVLAYGCFGVAYTAYATFVVATLRGLHVGSTGIALVWGSLGVAALVGALGIDVVLRGPLRSAAFAIALLCGAIGCAITALPNLAAIVAGALTIGLGFVASPAIASALSRERSSASTAAKAFASITVVFGCGQILGPLAGGFAADRWGAGSTATVAAVLYLVGAGFALLDGRIRDRSTTNRVRKGTVRVAQSKAIE